MRCSLPVFCWSRCLLCVLLPHQAGGTLMITGLMAQNGQHFMLEVYALAPVARESYKLNIRMFDQDGAFQELKSSMIPPSDLAQGTFLHLGLEEEWQINDYLKTTVPNYVQHPDLDLFYGNDVVELYADGFLVDSYGFACQELSQWSYREGYSYRKDGDCPGAEFNGSNWDKKNWVTTFPLNQFNQSTGCNSTQTRLFFADDSRHDCLTTRPAESTIALVTFSADTTSSSGPSIAASPQSTTALTTTNSISDSESVTTSLRETMAFKAISTANIPATHLTTLALLPDNIMSRVYNITHRETVDIKYDRAPSEAQGAEAIGSVAITIVILFCTFLISLDFRRYYEDIRQCLRDINSFRKYYLWSPPR